MTRAKCPRQSPEKKADVVAVAVSLGELCLSHLGLGVLFLQCQVPSGVVDELTCLVLLVIRNIHLLA